MKFLKKIDLKKALTHNLRLKIVSLAIAILVWVYVIGTITAGGSPT